MEDYTAPLYVFQFVETASLLFKSNVTTKTILDASIVRQFLDTLAAKSLERLQLVRPGVEMELGQILKNATMETRLVALLIV